ncbi:MAG TPA: methyl-accepting chemotaxis protein [Bacillota bacterium]|nr:methyl-accepting chemotaxis protein [Bacillota bacterium]
MMKNIILQDHLHKVNKIGIIYLWITCGMILLFISLRYDPAIIWLFTIFFSGAVITTILYRFKRFDPFIAQIIIGFIFTMAFISAYYIKDTSGEHSKFMVFLIGVCFVTLYMKKAYLLIWGLICNAGMIAIQLIHPFFNLIDIAACMVIINSCFLITYFVTKSGSDLILSNAEKEAQTRTLLGQLEETHQQALQSSKQVYTVASQIAVGNQELSQRTQEQATTLEEYAATIEEVGSSVQEVALHSVQAEQISQQTLSAVMEGSRSISETLKAIQEISTDSVQIGEIIKVMNDIAFQTNLLALNAAVEAAHAGQEGRGFAVVAAEVRNLAARAAESSKEIEHLIAGIINHIHKGNQLAQESAQALNQIVANTKRTSEIISNVSVAMQDQSAASGEIQITIEQLNQATQENAALVEEVSASSYALKAESEKLNSLVNQGTQAR